MTAPADDRLDALERQFAAMVGARAGGTLNEALGILRDLAKLETVGKWTREPKRDGAGAMNYYRTCPTCQFRTRLNTIADVVDNQGAPQHHKHCPAQRARDLLTFIDAGDGSAAPPKPAARPQVDSVESVADRPIPVDPNTIESRLAVLEAGRQLAAARLHDISVQLDILRADFANHTHKE